MSGAVITPHQRATIRSILSTYRDRIDRVALFGSHATGRARENSDIDLVIYDCLTGADVDRLWTLFDESPLSVSVDVLAYDESLYPPLRRHIDDKACTLFSHDDLMEP